MASRKHNCLLLFNLLLILPTKMGGSGQATGASLVEMLASIRDNGAGLFSTDFAGVRAFVCGDVNTKFELLRRLSRTFLSSNVLDIGESCDKLSHLAWAKGFEGDNPSLEAHQLLFVLDLDCPDSEEFLLRADGEMLFAAPFKWLMLQRANETSDLESVFAQKKVYPDSEVTVWRLSSGQLLSIYWASSRARCVIEDRGYWIRETNQVVVRDKNVASRRRKNLAGTRLKSCVVVTNPDSINHLTDYQDLYIDTVSKCNYPWAVHLVKMLNATVKFEQSGTWGYRSSNGTYNGMIGMLQRGEIDFGGTGGFLLKERMDVIHFIAPPTPTGSRFIFRRPPLSSVSNLFKLPFRNSVWFSICALVILLVILQYPAMRLEWLQLDEKQLEREPYPPDLSDDLLVILGSVSQQGSWYEPRSVSARIIVLMSLLAALNLYAAYTANIIALLQSTTTSINSLKDLFNSRLTLAAHDNVYNRYYFKTFKDPLRRAIFEERIEPRGVRKNNWLALEEGIERMRWGHFAFHVEPGSAYRMIQQTFEEGEKCGFHEIDFLNVFDPHFMVKRRSPYLELLRVSGLRLHEVGLRTRELTRLYNKKPMCTSNFRFRSVGLAESYGAFLTLLYGVMVAFGVFLAELLNVYLYVRKQRIGSLVSLET